MKLAKKGNFIYNILSEILIGKGVVTMFNIHNSKTKKMISSIIILILVLAMVVPTLASFIM